MSLLSRLFNPPPPPLADLWDWITRISRQPRWYLQHRVPDTLDGRFDMLALVTALVMLEMERRELRRETALLTEIFVADLDGALRASGIGDLAMARQMGRVIGALGGRVGAYRAALAAESTAGSATESAAGSAAGSAADSLADALARNVYRQAEALAEARALVPEVRALAQRIAAAPDAALLAGDIA